MNAAVMQAAGPVAAAIERLSWWLFGSGLLIFVGVMLLLLLALRREPGPVRTGLWIVGGGVLFPGVLLVVLFVVALPLTPVRQVPPADALAVTVTGRMWWWEVRYPAGDGEPLVITANQIHIPIGRTVAVALASDDVIHSFWVPALAGKVDMVPGQHNQLLLSANRPGVFRGQCAEYCGAQHARMALHVVAQTPADFAAWRQAQAAPAPAPMTPRQLQGREAFLAQRCIACHTVRGVAGEARLGPDLTHVGSRLQLGAGTLANSPGALAHWITHVQQLKPGARMPSFDRLDQETLAAIGDWLESLQ